MAEITPVDIQNKELRKSLLGYHRGQVDHFLDEITKTLDALLRENEALKEQVSELSQQVEQYRNIEDTLQHTLMIAQETADELRSNAKKESQLVLSQARTDADQLRERAEEELRQTRRRAEQIRAQMIEYLGRAVANTTAQIEILRSAQSEMESSPVLPELPEDVFEGKSGRDEVSEREWNDAE
ncbi:MAG: DivIVA domain-containing protein [Bacillota bacterium]